MRHRERDAVVCRKIIKEIDDVGDFLRPLSEEKFLVSRLHQKATVMSLLNIGELTKAFTDEFLLDTQNVPWHDIRSARNLAAHAYEAIDMRDVWETYRSDLPALYRSLDHALMKLRIQMRGKDRQ